MVLKKLSGSYKVEKLLWRVENRFNAGFSRGFLFVGTKNDAKAAGVKEFSHRMTKIKPSAIKVNELKF